jgi:hypothetical protein
MPSRAVSGALLETEPTTASHEVLAPARGSDLCAHRAQRRTAEGMWAQWQSDTCEECEADWLPL